jgi:hypothetical protein
MFDDLLTDTEEEEIEEEAKKKKRYKICIGCDNLLEEDERCPTCM